MKLIKSVNQLKWCLLFLVCMLFRCACDHGNKQGLISAVRITNTNGGAIISYKLLDTDSVAYVLARYNINDKVSREVQSPVKNNSITLDGFGSSKNYKVKFYTVTKSGDLSEPLAVSVHPKTPPYIITRATLKVEPDFGGVNIQATDMLNKKLGITVIRYDSVDQAENVIDNRILADQKANYTVREGDVKTQQIGVYVADMYGNHSDTVIKTIVTKPEALLDKSKFQPYPLASDTENGYNWFLPFLWDGHTDGASNGWHTNPAKQLPVLCTFSLGNVATLSHFVMWERPDDYCYKLGNPKDFSIWGTLSKKPKDTPIPVNAPVGTISGDWVNLGNYHFPDPPSGSKPEATVAADNSFVKAGVSFNIMLKNHPVTIIRVAVANTWSGVHYAHIMELSLYADSTSPK